MVAAAAAWSFAVGRTRFFTLPAEVIVATGIALLAMWALKRGSLRPRKPLPRHSAIVWLLMAVAVTGLELFAFVHADRSAYPTISSILNAIGLDTELGKSIVAFAWVAGGVWLLW